MEVLDFQADDIIVVSQDQIQQEIDGRRYVFIVADEEDGTVARKKYIETGESYDNRAIITNGLSVGDPDHHRWLAGADGRAEDQFGVGRRPVTFSLHRSAT